jgi:hypothetical protein
VSCALLLLGSSDFLHCWAGAICTRRPARPGCLEISRLILAWALEGRALGYPWYLTPSVAPEPVHGSESRVEALLRSSVVLPSQACRVRWPSAGFTRADPVGLAPSPRRSPGNSCRGLAACACSHIQVDVTSGDLLQPGPMWLRASAPSGCSPRASGRVRDWRRGSPSVSKLVCYALRLDPNAPRPVLTLSVAVRGSFTDVRILGVDSPSVPILATL